MRRIGQHDVAASVLAPCRGTDVIAARLDRPDDALRASRREKACRIVWRVEKRKTHGDDLVLHPLEAMECAFAAQRVLGEELHERVAAEGGDLIVRLEHVQRHSPAAPVDVVGGQRLHARKDRVARKANDWKRGSHAWRGKMRGRNADRLCLKSERGAGLDKRRTI